MLDSIVIQVITREQHADAGLRAIVVRAQLIELRDGIFREFQLPELQISLGQQVEILGLTRMFLNFAVSS